MTKIFVLLLGEPFYHGVIMIGLYQCINDEFVYAEAKNKESYRLR